MLLKTKKLLIMIALAIVQIAWGMEEEKQDTEELITIITKDCSDDIKVSKLVAQRIPVIKNLLIDKPNDEIDLGKISFATKDALDDIINIMSEIINLQKKNETKDYGHSFDEFNVERVKNVFKDKRLIKQIQTILLANYLMVEQNVIDLLIDNLSLKRISYKDILFFNDARQCTSGVYKKIVNFILPFYMNYNNLLLAEKKCCNGIYKKNPCQSLVFIPKENSLALGREDGQINLWNYKKNKLTQSIHEKGNFALNEIAFNPEKALLIVKLRGKYAEYKGDVCYFITSWCINEGELQKNRHQYINTDEIVGLRDEVVSLNKDGSFVAYYRSDEEFNNYIKVTSILNQKNLYYSDQDEDSSISLETKDRKFMGEHRFIALGKEMVADLSCEGHIRLWHTKIKENVKCLGTTKNKNAILKFNHNEEILALIDYNNIILWDTGTGKELKTLKSCNCKKIAFSGDGKMLASASHFGTIKIWNLDAGQDQLKEEIYIDTFKAHDEPITDLVFSPQGRYLASASDAGDVKLWDINNIHQIQSQKISLSQGLFCPYYKQNNGKDRSKSLYESLPPCIKQKLPAPSQSSWIGKGFTDIILKIKEKKDDSFKDNKKVKSIKVYPTPMQIFQDRVEASVDEYKVGFLTPKYNLTQQYKIKLKSLRMISNK